MWECLNCYLISKQIDSEYSDDVVVLCMEPGDLKLLDNRLNDNAIVWMAFALPKCKIMLQD